MARCSTTVLADLLTGDTVPPPIAWEDGSLLAAAIEHRVHLLLAERPAGCPPHINAQLQSAVREGALVEQLQFTSTARVLDALAGAGVRPVLFKGAALAYTCYSKPYHRPRNDVDLFIRKQDEPAVRAVMEYAGYRRADAISGDRVTHQFQYSRSDTAGVVCEFDFHWRLANPALFSDLLTFEEITRDAVDVPALGRTGRAPSPVHSLFIACMHRVAHHDDGDHLLWLYDIHLLATSLTIPEWREFESLAVRTSMRAVCGKGLRLAADLFGTRVPRAIQDAFADAPLEPSAAFIGGGFSRLDIELSNFRHLSGWRARGQLVWQHLFPDRRYMLNAYHATNPMWLPALYAHRIARGAVRWVRPMRPVS
ncbi:MAG TPA: nucleotidyltransferase family protein [Vicinamibacterales bacterium]|nr:nucleotidyltransferase family protein [Vicinamibacterales bacterium]